MEPDTVTVGEWSPPLRNSSLPGFDDTFTSVPIVLQPSSSDASSTATLASSTTLTSSAHEESSCSLRTTPESITATTLGSLNLTDQVAQQIQNGSAVATKSVNEHDISKTRRRSTRIQSKQHTAAPPNAPTTPHPRVTALKSSSVSNTPSPDSIARNLRSSSKRTQTQDDVPEPTPAPARRKSTRISALANKTAETPKGRGTKRSHEVMAAGSRSAGAKLGGSYGDQRADSKDSSSSRSSSEDSSAGSDALAADHPRPKKKWVSHGLYVGQQDESSVLMRPKKGVSRARNKRPNALPLPMFFGKNIMEAKRDFKLPYDVYAPSAVKYAPPSDWKRLNHNILVGDAQHLWSKKPQSTPRCTCKTECDETCLNRACYIECNDETCGVGRRGCTNRPFADLQGRVKSRKKFNDGVELIMTHDRGYGLRAARSFEPGQIIVEYTGEIITQEESECRMEEVYKDNKNYYLMLFDQNMILDATRGSIARFVNHSCEPNCRMEKWLVMGKPRMALFAGSQGVETGAELTYDYNFNWFKGVTQQSCKCGSEKCRGTLGKRTDGTKKAKTTTKGTKTTKLTKPSKVTKTLKKVQKLTKKVTEQIVMAVTKKAPPPTTTTATTKPERARRLERVQKSVIMEPAKPKRRPPTRRRPATPLPKEPTPELETLPSTSDDDDESDLSGSELPTPRVYPRRMMSPKADPPERTKLHSLRTRARVMRTYKTNKTIAKSITSEAAVAAAREMALGDALSSAMGPIDSGSKAAGYLAVAAAAAHTLSTDDITAPTCEEDLGEGEAQRNGMSIGEVLNAVGGVAASPSIAVGA